MNLQSDLLFCNQNYVLGKNALRRLVQSKIFLSGLGSMGVEVAKNLVSSGVTQLTLQDHRPASHDDLSAQFLLTEDDVRTSRNRAQASHIKLAALNPQANIQSIETSLESSYQDVLKDHDCAILTEVDLPLQKLINTFCRNQVPPIKFISADSYGPLASLFCDFGNTFSVADCDGEETEELHVTHISKSDPGIVTCHDSCRLDGYKTGDWVEISLARGMLAVNKIPLQIDVLSPNSFSICDTTLPNYQEYVGGGTVKKLKYPAEIHFESLEEQVYKPKIYFPSEGSTAKFQNAHLAWLSLHSFTELHKRPPNPWDDGDAGEVFQHAVNIQDQHCHFKVQLDANMIQTVAYTYSGRLPPLTTAMGGFCAQEALKAVTGKFMPLQQWLHLDYSQLISTNMVEKPLVHNDRYSTIRVCLGDDMVQRLQHLELFIVGCSAASSEYLKNAALLGIGTLFGKITLADDAVVKHLNLGQQFLLPNVIAKENLSKCSAIADAIKAINPAICIETILHKVCPDTATVFNERFFAGKKVVMTALDSMESRRYVDSLCVKHSIPLIDCGTTGTKGHVQVVIPHHTESFSCKYDPSDPEYPYCVLKSFPTKLEHTVQWAREKFENFFFLKPTAFNNFWLAHDPKIVFQNLENNIVEEHLAVVLKYLNKVPTDFSGCLRLARIQYEKYYVNKARQLLQNFPADLTIADGSLFWQFPKLRPVPVVFDSADDMHMKFVTSMACLLAHVSGIVPNDKENSSAFIKTVLESTKVPEFKPNNKEIITDESMSKPTTNYEDEIDPATMMNELILLLSNKINSDQKYLKALDFETSGQQAAVQNFITAAATLRAQMYGIEVSFPDKINAIARRLVPFLPTTTAVAAGFAMLELLQMLCQLPNGNHRNYFFNLAVPEVVTCSPSPVKVMVLSNGISFTLWDRWLVNGPSTYTLRHLLEELKIKSGSDVSLVAEGTRMVYMPLITAHKKRLDQLMTSLIQHDTTNGYIELAISYEGEGEDIMGPPVRYHFAQ